MPAHWKAVEAAAAVCVHYWGWKILKSIGPFADPGEFAEAPAGVVTEVGFMRSAILLGKLVSHAVLGALM